MPEGKKDKGTNRIKRRRKIVSFVLIGLCVYFIYSIIVLRINISKEQQSLNTLENRVEAQKLVNEELERIIYNDGEREYIERIAREKLGYAAIDERIFVDLAGS